MTSPPPSAQARTSRSGPHPWYVAVIAGLASFVDGAALSANGWALVILQTRSASLPGNSAP